MTVLVGVEGSFFPAGRGRKVPVPEDEGSASEFHEERYEVEVGKSKYAISTKIPSISKKGKFE